jgi:hypothetical protein
LGDVGLGKSRGITDFELEVADAEPVLDGAEDGDEVLVAPELSIAVVGNVRAEVMIEVEVVVVRSVEFLGLLLKLLAPT